MPVSRKLFALTLLTAFIGAVPTAGPSRADDAAPDASALSTDEAAAAAAGWREIER